MCSLDNNPAPRMNIVKRILKASKGRAPERRAMKYDSGQCPFVAAEE